MWSTASGYMRYDRQLLQRMLHQTRVARKGKILIKIEEDLRNEERST